MNAPPQQEQFAPLTPELARDLWYAVQAYGVAIWETALAKDSRPDGLAAWQPLKALLDECRGKGQWRPELLESLGENGSIGPAPLAQLEAWETKDGGSVDREHAHYFAQLLRIPLREDCSLRRLCQIAYNAGQLSGSAALTALAEQDKSWPDLYGGEALGRPETFVSLAPEALEALSVPADLLATIRHLTSQLRA